MYKKFMDWKYRWHVTGLLIIVLIGIFIVWCVPYWLVSWDKLLAKVESGKIKDISTAYDKYYDFVASYRGTIIKIYSGIIVILGLCFAYKRTKALEERNTNEKDKIKEQRQSNIRSLTLDQYVKAVNQLGNKNNAVRLGGIYSLEQIMNSKNEEDEKYHNIIIELLATYVRNMSKIDYKDDIIQSIIIVLGRRAIRDNEVKINFDEANLSNYSFDHLKFENAGFSATKLKNSKFFNASLESSYFSYAKLENVFFIKTKINNSDFSNASLESTHFLDARLENCNFTSTKLKNSDFHTVSLENTRFNFAKLENSKFHYTSLKNSFFIMCFFNKTDFTEADLRGATFNKIQHDVDRLDFIKELKKAKYVQGIKLDKEIMDIIKKDFPDLLKRIETGEGEEDIEDS